MYKGEEMLFDVAADENDVAMQNALRHLEEITPLVRVMGSYPTGGQISEVVKQTLLTSRARQALAGDADGGDARRTVTVRAGGCSRAGRREEGTERTRSRKQRPKEPSKIFSESARQQRSHAAEIDYLYDTPTIVSVDETIARHGAPNNYGHPRMEYNMDP